MRGVTDQEISQAVAASTSLMESIHRLGKPVNGHTYQGIKRVVARLGLSTGHFRDGRFKVTKWQRAEKRCPVCSKPFQTRPGHPREKMTCSNKCSNLHKPRGNILTPTHYRTLCFAMHQKVCVVCTESKIVGVHHYDGNHDNDAQENLIPLCPTHHQYVHSRYRDEVIPAINAFREEVLRKMATA